MKIVFFTPTLNVGGYEKVVIGFANQIARATEHEVMIVCCNGEGALKEQIDTTIKVTSLQCKTRNMVLRLASYLSQEKPDVLYTGFRIYNIICMLSKYCSGCRSLKVCISQHGYENTNWFLKPLYAFILNKADLLIGVTESLRKYEIEDLALKCKSTVVGNPVISENMPIPIIRRQNDIYVTVVTCGRLSVDKNFDLAIRIVNELIRRGKSIKLLLIGDGPERQNLERLTDELSIRNEVSFTGYVKEPIHYLAKGDVYLHTCDREGFGNTVVEAMYAGLPVVTTDCGGPVDLIKEDQFGVCFGNGRSADSYEKGADAIETVLKNRGAYSNQQKRAMDFMTSSVTRDLLREIEAILC